MFSLVVQFNSACIGVVSIFLLFKQAYYYCAILEDVILRFAWTIPLSLGVLAPIQFISDIVATVLAPLEVFR